MTPTTSAGDTPRLCWQSAYPCLKWRATSLNNSRSSSESARVVRFGRPVVMLHGLFSGTDTGASWAQLIYASTGLSVVLLTIYRVVRQQP